MSITLFVLGIIIKLKPNLQKYTPPLISCIIMYVLVEKRMADSPPEFFRTREGYAFILIKNFRFYFYIVLTEYVNALLMTSHRQ